MTEKNWNVKWNKEEIDINCPVFKEFKTKKDFFTEKIPEIMYKAPYKYHFKWNFEEKDCFLQFKLVTENCLAIENETTTSASKEVFQNPLNEFKFSFHFNICSYKYNGERFRIHLSVSQKNEKILELFSNPFVIKSKKPPSKEPKEVRINEGIKRKLEDEEEIETQKKLKPIQNFQTIKPIPILPKEKVMNMISGLSKLEAAYTLCKLMESVNPNN
jgi:hypothetical protein